MMRIFNGFVTLGRRGGFFVFVCLGVVIGMTGSLFSEEIPRKGGADAAIAQVSPEEGDAEQEPVEGSENVQDPLEGKEGNLESFEALPGFEKSPRFQYKSHGGRDPFLSFVDPQGKDLSRLPPLQRVAVSDLKLIGVARSSGRVSAMLQTPDGKSYPVSHGTRVGNNKGRVGHIGEESITIHEPHLNIFGRTALRQVVIKLYTKKEGQE